MAACPLQVAVRIRPPQPHDGKAGAPAVEAADGVTLQAKEGSESKQFAFDRVFGPVPWLSKGRRNQKDFLCVSMFL